MKKTYTEPKFVLISSDENNKVFFAASGAVGLTPTATLGTMSKNDASW